MKIAYAIREDYVGLGLYDGTKYGAVERISGAQKPTDSFIILDETFRFCFPTSHVLYDLSRKLGLVYLWK